jgi:hypothetical protein
MPTKGFHNLSQWALDILNNIGTFNNSTFLSKNNNNLHNTKIYAIKHETNVYI